MALCLIIQHLQLTDATRAEVKHRASSHCQICGHFAFDGENAHEAAHVVASAISPEAFRLYATAAHSIHKTFPRHLTLDHPGNILYLQNTIHRGIDGHSVALYIPDVQYDSGRKLIASTVELQVHDLINDKDEHLHQSPLRLLVASINETRNVKVCLYRIWIS